MDTVYADNGVTLRENALFGLGKVIDSATSMTVGEDSMLGQADMLGWDIEKRPLVNEDGHLHSDKFEITRLDPSTGERKVFDNVVVGSKYYPIQNEKAFLFADSLMDFGAKPEQVFSFNGGRRVGGTFGLADLDLDIGGVDKLQAKLLVLTSHDGSASLTARIIEQRLFCTNQISGMLKHYTNQVVIRHTASAEYNVHEAQRTLGMAGDWVREIERIAEGLVQVPMTTGQFAEMATDIYPKPETAETTKRATARWSNQINLLESIFDGSAPHGDTTGQIGGTAWAGFNALTERLDWYRNTGNSLELGRTRAAQAMGIIGHLDKTKSGILSQVESFVDSMPETIAV
jgi:hypothetical protein